MFRAMTGGRTCSAPKSLRFSTRSLLCAFQEKRGARKNCRSATRVAAKTRRAREAAINDWRDAQVETLPLKGCGVCA
jgi:hypothetical protein